MICRNKPGLAKRVVSKPCCRQYLWKCDLNKEKNSKLSWVDGLLSRTQTTHFEVHETVLTQWKKWRQFLVSMDVDFWKENINLCRLRRKRYLFSGLIVLSSIQFQLIQLAGMVGWLKAKKTDRPQQIQFCPYKRCIEGNVYCARCL